MGGGLGAGLLMTLKAFRVYVASVLLFIGQLEDLPTAFRHHESVACRKLFPGPTNWMTADGFRELKSLHFPEELKDIESIAIAANARVVRLEANGTLDIQSRAEKIRCLTCSSNFGTLQRLGWLGDLRNNSFLLSLDRAHRRVEAAISQQPARGQWEQQAGWQRRATTIVYSCNSAPAQTPGPLAAHPSTGFTCQSSSSCAASSGQHLSAAGVGCHPTAPVQWLVHSITIWRAR